MERFDGAIDGDSGASSCGAFADVHAATVCTATGGGHRGQSAHSVVYRCHAYLVEGLSVDKRWHGYWLHTTPCFTGMRLRNRMLSRSPGGLKHDIDLMSRNHEAFRPQARGPQNGLLRGISGGEEDPRQLAQFVEEQEVITGLREEEPELLLTNAKFKKKRIRKTWTTTKPAWSSTASRIMRKQVYHESSRGSATGRKSRCVKSGAEWRHLPRSPTRRHQRRGGVC